MKPHAPNYGPGNCFSLAGRGREETLLEASQLYKLEAQQTAGALLCLELSPPPGTSVPPHTHELEDETFYVVKGSVRFTGCGLPRPVTLEPGGLFYNPRGRLHGFHNIADVTGLLFVTLMPRHQHARDVHRTCRPVGRQPE